MNILFGLFSFQLVSMYRMWSARALFFLISALGFRHFSGNAEIEFQNYAWNQTERFKNEVNNTGGFEIRKSTINMKPILLSNVEIYSTALTAREQLRIFH